MAISEFISKRRKPIIIILAIILVISGVLIAFSLVRISSVKNLEKPFYIEIYSDKSQEAVSRIMQGDQPKPDQVGFFGYDEFIKKTETASFNYLSSVFSRKLSVGESFKKDALTPAKINEIKPTETSYLIVYRYETVQEKKIDKQTVKYDRVKFFVAHTNNEIVESELVFYENDKLTADDYEVKPVKFFYNPTKLYGFIKDTLSEQA